MKKSICVTIILIMVLSMFGCGTPGDGAVSTTTSTQVTTTIPTTVPTTPPVDVQLDLYAGMEFVSPDFPAAFAEVLNGRTDCMEAYWNVKKNLWDFYFPNMCSNLDAELADVAFVDMDQDGKEEMVLNMFDTLILREQDGKVYGYDFSFRQIYTIYKDGTFSPVEHVDSGGKIYRLEFLENGKYVQHVLCRQEYVDGEPQSYVDEKPVSEAEFERVFAEHENSGELEWKKLKELVPFDNRYRGTAQGMHRLVACRFDDEFMEVCWPEIPFLDASIHVEAEGFSEMFLDLTDNIDDTKYGNYYYTYADLNQDGELEFIYYRKDGFIHAIFTIVDGEPQMVDVFWSKRKARITQSGDIMILANDGAGMSVSVVQLIPNSTEYNTVAEFGVIGFAETGTQYYKVIDGSPVAIDEQRFNEWMACDLMDVPFAVYIPFVVDLNHGSWVG